MRDRSIRFKLTLWFSLILTAVACVTLLAVLEASRMVLRGTIRDYLISTVEENVDKIQVTDSRRSPEANFYLPCGESLLEIDTDFMDVVNDVHTALYTSDGSMLYGDNPLARQTAACAFTESCTWHMDVQGLRYDLYDRQLNLRLADGRTLWIRGVVPELKSAQQLREITRISLILLPLLIALAVLSGYLLVARLLAPLRKIENTAERISRGDDLRQRIDLGGSNDEVGRLARVFNRMLDRLEQAFEAERRFTSDASHELRTPTSVILAQSEYSLERERTTEEYVEALRVIRKQGRRMSALIGDMLDYTRLDQRAGQYPMEPLDLSQLSAETAEQLALLGEKGIALRCEIEPGLCVSGNRMLLSRLLQNLISNAYRYGREQGHILVSLRREAGSCLLSVTDDGVGIAPEEQEKIFDRFYRSDASRTVRGTGLGLSMVKRIVEQHGATISVESEPGRGSSFRVSFPLVSEL